MKKFICLFSAVMLAVLASFSLFACNGGSNSYVQYGKKYVSGNSFYSFSSNKTGYYEIHTTDGDLVLAGKIEFIWSMASDGRVYLFETSRSYLDGNTSESSFSIIQHPLAFGKDFFAFTTTGGYIGQYSGSVSTNCIRYVVEGSDLYKAENN